jgi:hypothetical protein
VAVTYGGFLRRILRGLGLLALVALAGVTVVGVLARFGDGPLGLLPGGPLRKGELSSAEGVDWSFAEGIREVELQLLAPPRSRTTWIVVHGGQLYIPCGFLRVPLWKQWPHEALRDGRGLLRVGGKRYPVQLVKVADPEIYARVIQRVAHKYGFEGEQADPAQVWIFRLDPRSES